MADSAYSKAFILDAELHDDRFQVHFDGLKKVYGHSDAGDFHYVPVLFYEGRQVHKTQHLLLAAIGCLLGRVQGKVPDRGIIYHGNGCTVTTIRLTAGLRRMRRLVGWQMQADKLLAVLVNTLSISRWQLSPCA